ncbi:hypothetical protein MKX01_016779 [Papaver californicum]|nr:hypothetical protein MKX01_016779 [Papaver californicum]
MWLRIALNIKPLKYDYLEETFGSKSELLLKPNHIYKKIHVMIHGDKPISSSGYPIVPSDLYDAFIARLWTTYIDDKFFPSLTGIAKRKDAEERKAVIEVIAGYGRLEEAYLESKRIKIKKILT